MNIKLEDCTLITNIEYMDLVDPRFEGQTKVNHQGEYYMIFSSEGKFYKTSNKI